LEITRKQGIGLFWREFENMTIVIMFPDR